MDDFGVIAAPGFSYRLTPDDVLWLARSAAFEGDPAAVVWTYAQRLTLPEFRGWSMARLVQGHSQPTNPRWGRDGDFCRRPDGICWQTDAPGKCFDQAGASMCSDERLRRRDQARSVTWASLGISVRSIVERFATARLSNPVPRSVDFAAGYVSGRDGLEVVKRLRNTFWSNPSSRSWSADRVRIELGGRVATGSDGLGLLGLLALGAAAAGGAYAVKRYRKRRGLGALNYPPQPCGLDYKSFRGGWDYAAAYENVAWGRGDAPRTVTPGVVKREMGRLKKAEFERYKADCEEGKAEIWDDDIDPRDFLDGIRRAAGS